MFFQIQFAGFHDFIRIAAAGPCIEARRQLYQIRLTSGCALRRGAPRADKPIARVHLKNVIKATTDGGAINVTFYSIDQTSLPFPSRAPAVLAEDRGRQNAAGGSGGRKGEEALGWLTASVILLPRFRVWADLPGRPWAMPGSLGPRASGLFAIWDWAAV